jgi:peptidyl-prolyl cis-trans isomerase A (cyclophilin A)
MRTIFVAVVVLAASLSFGQAAAGAKPPVRTPAAAAASTGSGPTAVIHTTAGDMRCELFPKEAPIGVANFIGLSEGTKDWTSPVSHAKKHGVPLYNGTIFHRVIPQFMIQGGDPAGNGQGDPGYKFKNETTPELKFDRPGRLAYANAGPGTNGSQFFITEVPYPSLNGGYTIFGQCDPAAVELVKSIARMATDGETPLRPVKISRIEIQKSGSSAKPAAPRLATPKMTPGTKPSAATKKPSAQQ